MATLDDPCGNKERICMWNKYDCNPTVQGCQVVCKNNPCAGLGENDVCGSGKRCKRNQMGCSFDQNGCRLVCKPDSSAVPSADPMGYYGTKFVTGFMQNSDGLIGVPTLMITCKGTAIVRVEIPFLSVDEIYTVTSYESLTYSKTITHSTSNAIEEKAVFITSDVLIMVYVADLQPYSSDGTVIMPTPTLTTEYFIAGYPFTSDRFLDQFVVIGVSDNTMVTVEYRDPALSSTTITLNQNQTYYEAGFDLTGTNIVSSSPIAVLSGHMLTKIYSISTSDQIMESMPPVTSLDTVHVISYMKPRPDFTVSIVATVDSTQITIYDIDGNILEDLQPLMRKDTVFRTYTGSKTISIVSSAPVMIHQYGHSSIRDYNYFGDASMMFVPGVEHYGKQYEFVAPSSSASHTLLMVLSELYPPASLKLNGESFTPTQVLTVTIPSVGIYQVVYADVQAGFNTLAYDNADATIGAWLYGSLIQQEYAWSLGYAV